MVIGNIQQWESQRHFRRIEQSWEPAGTFRQLPQRRGEVAAAAAASTERITETQAQTSTAAATPTPTPTDA
jgi:hypothetical protein